MFERFNEQAKRTIVSAQEEARALAHPAIGPEHILLALLRDTTSPAGKTLADLGVSFSAVEEQVRAQTPVNTDTVLPALPFTPGTKAVLEQSLREALALGSSVVGTEHLLLALVAMPATTATQILLTFGVRLQDLHQRLTDAARDPEQVAPALTGPTPRGGFSKTSILDTFGRNLTRAATSGDLDPVMGRERETERVIQTLTRKTKNNPVLVGEAGVGKTAVVEGLAHRLANSQGVPAALAGKQLYSIDLGAMVAGTRFRGDFEERLKKLLAEVTSRKDVIMFLDEIHTLVGAGAGEGAMDAAQLLKPLLARGEIQLIGATTYDEYRKHIEKDSALERRFSPVIVDEPTVAETVTILRGLKDRFEAHHRLTIGDDALTAAARLTSRYLPDRRLPDKAIDVLDEAASRLRLLRETSDERLGELGSRISRARAQRSEALAHGDLIDAERLAASIRDLESDVAQTLDVRYVEALGADQVAQALAASTGIPLARLGAAEAERLLGLADAMRERVIGQDEAVDKIASAVRRSRAGVSDPRRPAGSFLFAGPTGVGKTETAKALAEFLFGTDEALLSLDMSEYSEKHTVARLVGAPPGYVGYDEAGQLTEAVRRRPFSVLLFDEVEKAHPDVFNILLQVLEEGHLTDSQGRRVDFRNAIIVLTTNLGGVEAHRASLGFGESTTSAQAAVASALKAHFRPEFLNRLDETVVFSPLAPEHILDIAVKFAGDIGTRLVERGYDLHLTPAALESLARRGYDPAYGARPLRRLFAREVEDALATALLTNPPAPGTRLVIDAGPDGELVLSNHPVIAAAA